MNTTQFTIPTYKTPPKTHCTISLTQTAFSHTKYFFPQLTALTVSQSLPFTRFPQHN